MADRLTVPQIGPDGGLTRSRSSSSPSAPRKDEKTQPAIRPARPSHTRSHSYMSPRDLKPTSAATFPSVAPEKPAETSRFSRLHLPGRHHLHHHNNNTKDEEPRSGPRLHGTRHRYTQSEAQQYHKKRDSTLSSNESPGTPTATSASSTHEQPNDLLYASSRGAPIPTLTRMTSTRSYRGNQPGDKGYHMGQDPRAGSRRRATSDPRSPAHDPSPNQQRPTYKSPIEMELERADLRRRLFRESMTEKDVQRKDTELKAATHELHDRFSASTRSASDLMRRLDDAQDTLARTTESLVDTISSFNTLSDQSSKLISNFEHESQHLDRETRQRISHYRNSICAKRGKRVGELEQRGQTMSQKAEELGRRLENCRIIVNNWEQREANKRKTWRGIWVGVLWGVAFIVVAVVAGIVSWKAADIRRGGGTADARLRHLIVHNRSYDVDTLKDVDVPESVREILADIDQRVRNRRGWDVPVVSASEEMVKKEDRGIRLLDEL